MKKNVFTLILEKGSQSTEGISFNEMVEYLQTEHNIQMNEDFRLSLGLWFCKNFVYIKYNHSHFQGRTEIKKKLIIYDNIPPSGLGADGLKSRFEEKMYLSGNAYMTYLDYVELEQARKSSKTATWIAIAAIIISIFLTIVQIISN